MSVLKLFAVLTILVGSVAMVLGTGAFTAVEADRFTDVGVADDDSALLGIGIEGGTADPGEEVTLITATNQFDSRMEVNAEVVDEGPFENVVIQETPDSLPSGGSGEITATVGGSPSTAGEIELEITAQGAFETVTLTRDIYVEIERVGLPTCTIENDDRIGETELDADNEIFDCHIEIDADGNYEVVSFENSTVEGAFELTADNNLMGFDFDDSEIKDDVEITIGNNLPGSATLEIRNTDIDGDLTISIDKNVNGDIVIEDNEIGGDLTVEGQVTPAGSVTVEDNEVGGDRNIETGGGQPGR